MKSIRFYFDVISPYAWLAFQRLPQVLQGHSHQVDYVPVVLGAVLSHHGQLGPAEIGPKRDWTYRHVLWLGRQLGVPLDLPACHPFNSLALQRLAVACGSLGLPNRWVCETLFRHVWQGGADPNDPQRLAALQAELQPARDPAGADVKAELRAHTDAALAAGVFGVPTLVVDGRLFWGLDGLPLLADALAESPWFAGPDWESVRQLPVGVKRQI